MWTVVSSTFPWVQGGTPDVPSLRELLLALASSTFPQPQGPRPRGAPEAGAGAPPSSRTGSHGPLQALCWCPKYLSHIWSPRTTPPPPPPSALPGEQIIQLPLSFLAKPEVAACEFLKTEGRDCECSSTVWFVIIGGPFGLLNESWGPGPVSSYPQTMGSIIFLRGHFQSHLPCHPPTSREKGRPQPI